MVDLCEDINITNLSLDNDEKEFHTIIGHIEDILMDDRFTEVHREFMEKHWKDFEDSEENKLSYTDTFNEYIGTIEKFIENELNQRVANFNMSQFEVELKNRSNELEGEIFELLSTFTDFCAFKSMVLDYKNMKEGKVADFSSDFFVSKCTFEDCGMEETAF